MKKEELVERKKEFNKTQEYLEHGRRRVDNTFDELEEKLQWLKNSSENPDVFRVAQNKLLQNRSNYQLAIKREIYKNEEELFEINREINKKK